MVSTALSRIEGAGQRRSPLRQSDYASGAAGVARRDRDPRIPAADTAIPVPTADADAWNALVAELEFRVKSMLAASFLHRISSLRHSGPAGAESLARVGCGFQFQARFAGHREPPL
jgi:hypothetical protein